jgi:uncharacterized protein
MQVSVVEKGKVESMQAYAPVSLKPFHVFVDDEDRIVLINPEEMLASEIDEGTAKFLKTFSQTVNAVPSAADRQAFDDLQLIWHEPESLRAQKPKPVTVNSLSLFVTQECNFRCSYCYGDGGSYGTGGEMDQETAFQTVEWLIAQAEDEPVLTVHFFGGEPFLKFKLMQEVVDYCYKRGAEAEKEFKFEVTTNGSLVDEEQRAFLKKHKVKTFVSFDGTKELQDKQRPLKGGKGSYDMTAPKVKKIVEEIPSAIGRSMGIGQSDGFVAHKALRKLGFTHSLHTVNSPSLFGNGSELPTRDFTGIFNNIESEAYDIRRSIRERDTEKLRHLSKGMMFKHVEQFTAHRKRHFICNAGRSYVGVSSAGNVFLCHRLVGADEFKLGDVFDGDLERDNYQVSPVNIQENCKTCHAKYICSGGCYHDNKGISGSAFQADESMCPYTQRAAELAAMVSSGLSEADTEYLCEEKFMTMDSSDVIEDCKKSESRAQG